MSVQNQDFIKGFDPTLLTEISPSQLAQMVDAATPASDKGLWVTTTDDGAGNPDVPDAASNTKLQNYGWKRVSANAVTLYIWNPNVASNVVYQKWVNIITAQYAPDTIPATAIQRGTIGDLQINSISASKISGLPTTLAPSGNAGGDLDGSTYPNPVVKALAITGGSAAGKIANKTINDYNIADAGITFPTKAVLGAANVIYKMKSDASAWEAKDYITGNGGKKIRVNAGATDFEAVDETFTKAMFTTLSNALSVDTTGATANFHGTYAHGLGAVPKYLKVVAVCTADDATTGYVTGDEYDLAGFICRTADTIRPPLSWSADATNVHISYFLNASGGFKIVKKDGSTVAAMTYANWKFKIYAAL